MSAEIPEFTDKSEVKRPKLNVKPIFKLKISHLLNIVYDKINECFKFENNEVNIVMCCGRITDIFRDDSIFSFESKEFKIFGSLCLTYYLNKHLKLFLF